MDHQFISVPVTDNSCVVYHVFPFCLVATNEANVQRTCKEVMKNGREDSHGPEVLIKQIVKFHRLITCKIAQINNFLLTFNSL